MLIGRQLGLRLVPSVALWCAKGLNEIFGWQEEIFGAGQWPGEGGVYGRPLWVKCQNLDVDGKEGEVGCSWEREGWASFRVVEQEDMGDAAAAPAAAGRGEGGGDGAKEEAVEERLSSGTTSASSGVSKYWG